MAETLLITVYIPGLESQRPDALLTPAGTQSTPHPVLFLAETIFVYFREAQVKAFVFTLRDHFPGAELIFNGWMPFEIWLVNRSLSKSQFAGLMHWGFWRGQELEGWGGSIHLLDEWPKCR